MVTGQGVVSPAAFVGQGDWLKNVSEPGSVVPPADVIHGLLPGLSTERSVVPRSRDASYAPASPAEAKALCPWAASSRNASSNVWTYPGSSCAAFSVYWIAVCDSPQLDETLSATLSLAAWKNASTNPLSVFGAW